MKAKIWKIPYGRDAGMWVGLCSCGRHLKYWSFGATLGATLEHHRRRCVR